MALRTTKTRHRFRGIGWTHPVLVIALALTFLAFDWKWQFPEEKTKKEPSAPESVEKAPSAEEIDLEEQQFQAIEDQAKLIKSLKPPAVPQTSVKIPKVAKVPKAAQFKVPSFPKITRTKKPPTVTSVPVVQQRIKEIIEINKTIKPQFRSHAKELQRISNQAKIHQQILKDLQRAKKQRAISVPPNTAELVRQEKIRLISEETKTNYDFLSDLGNLTEATNKDAS